MVFQNFAGNALVRRRLDEHSRNGGLHHAYIIAGPEGSGKKTLARIIAAAMVCSGDGEKPCLRCPNCKKAMKDIHPDVLWLKKTEKLKTNTISVDDIRDYRKDIHVMPNEADAKVMIVPDAQMLNIQGMNALLKELEEGPDYLAFLLLCTTEEQYLETVRSRCETLLLSSVPEEECAAFLRRNYPERSEDDIRSAVRIGRGNLGRARKYLDENAEDRIVPLARAVADTVLEKKELQRLKLLLPIEKWERDDLAELVAAIRAELIARLPDDSLTAGQKQTIVRDADLLVKISDAVQQNVKGSALSGWLAAAL